MPFSRAITYKLIGAELISSVVVTWPGSGRGRRLIDGDSLDSYLESLTAKQAVSVKGASRGSGATVAWEIYGTGSSSPGDHEINQHGVR
jgi:hypothetical protein